MTGYKLQAGESFPTMSIPQLGGGSIDLGQSTSGFDWKLVVIYRGKHCPVCTRYLQSLNSAVAELGRIGVDVVAVSADSKARATEHMAQVSPQFTIGFDLNVEQMTTLGLYISGPKLGMDAERPFAEPGLFVINDARNLQVIDISNVPFARPSFDSMLMGLRYIRNLDGKFPVNGSFA